MPSVVISTVGLRRGGSTNTGGLQLPQAARRGPVAEEMYRMLPRRILREFCAPPLGRALNI